MKASISLSSSPWGEAGVQTVDSDYDNKAPRECRAYTGQLQRLYQERFDKELPCRLVVKSNPHDFGNYYDVHVVFDDQDPEQVEAAYWLENHSPENWDDIAAKEIR